MFELQSVWCLGKHLDENYAIFTAYTSIRVEPYKSRFIFIVCVKAVSKMLVKLTQPMNKQLKETMKALQYFLQHTVLFSVWFLLIMMFEKT